MARSRPSVFESPQSRLRSSQRRRSQPPSVAGVCQPIACKPLARLRCRGLPSDVRAGGHSQVRVLVAPGGGKEAEVGSAWGDGCLLKTTCKLARCQLEASHALTECPDGTCAPSSHAWQLG